MRKRDGREWETECTKLFNFFCLILRWLTVYTVPSLPSSSTNACTDTTPSLFIFDVISFDYFIWKISSKIHSFNNWSRTLAVIHFHSSPHCVLFLPSSCLMSFPVVYKLNLHCLSLLFFDGSFGHWPDQWLHGVVNQCIDFLRLCIPSKVCTALYCSHNFSSIVVVQFSCIWIICFSLNLYALCGISCPSIL